MRRVVSLYLPEWPTDLWRRRVSGSPEAPVVLVARDGAKRVVTAADARARALGLVPGLAASAARARVPDLVVGTADPEGDRAALDRLTAWCLERLSPLAAPAAPDGIWIDMTGGAHLFGGEAAMLARLCRGLRRAGFASRAAIAGTPGAAHAAARFGRAVCTVVPPDGEAAALAPLPVEALRLSAPVLDGLSRLGFDTVGRLMAAPRAPMTRRFGMELTRALDRALGTLPEPIEPARAPETPSTRQGFPEPISTPDDLARVTRLLAERLCGKLLERGLGARRLDLVFRRVDGVAQWARITLAAPSREPAHIVRLLLPKIETIDPGFGIETVELAAPAAETLAPEQRVAAGLSRTRSVALARLVDRLSNRLGETRVFACRAVESDLPERSVRRMPPLAEAGADTWPDRLPRPPRLLHPPREIDAVALLPDHPPARFVWQKKAHRVRAADGPERVYGEWWRDARETSAVRDYFQVEDEEGRRFWLFRRGDGMDAATGDMKWFLHGLFG